MLIDMLMFVDVDRYVDVRDYWIDMLMFVDEVFDNDDPVDDVFDYMLFVDDRWWWW